MTTPFYDFHSQKYESIDYSSLDADQAKEFVPQNPIYQQEFELGIASGLSVDEAMGKALNIDLNAPRSQK